MGRVVLIAVFGFFLCLFIWINGMVAITYGDFKHHLGEGQTKVIFSVALVLTYFLAIGWSFIIYRKNR